MARTRASPRPVPAKIPGAGCIQPEEGLKDPLPQLRWDSGSLIGHGDGRIRTVRLCMDLDFPAFRPVLYRVFHQIEQCPAEQFSAAWMEPGAASVEMCIPLPLNSEDTSSVT